MHSLSRLFCRDTFWRPNSLKPNGDFSIAEETDNHPGGGGVSTRLYIKKGNGFIGIGSENPTSKLQVIGLHKYADNSAAIAEDLTVGAFYRTGDILKVVH